MICTRCKKGLATVRYAEVVDGEVTERHLCPGCLTKLEEDSAAGFAISAAAPAGPKPKAEQVVADAVQTLRACPTCGMVLSDILSAGRVGCAGCFETFSSEIDDLLEGLHRALRHKGKVINVTDERVQMRATLQSNRGLLRTALRAENYEEAARLRDEIKTIESGLHVSKSGAE